MIERHYFATCHARLMVWGAASTFLAKPFVPMRIKARSRDRKLYYMGGCITPQSCNLTMTWDKCKDSLSFETLEVWNARPCAVMNPAWEGN
jgi:hypothetical protein